MATKKKIEDIEIEDAEIVSESTKKEETFSEIPDNTNFSPFDEPVKERSYTSPNVNASDLPDEIEPSFSDFDEGMSDVSDSSEKSEPESGTFNPQFNELGKKEKEMGAEMMADIVIDGYSKLKTLMGGMATISESKLDKEFAEGTIDPNIKIPIDEFGNTATVKEFAAEFNESSKEAFQTSDEFKENVKPPMVRVFKKKGVGVTDEQLLIYYFGTDLIQSGITAFALKKSTNSILDNLREQTINTRQFTPPPAPPAPAPEPVKEQKRTEYVEPEEETFQAPKSNKDNSNFAEDYTPPKNMPSFGDKQVLSEIDKIAEKEGTAKESPKKRRRGRPKKNK
jgi:hypothetical protein